MTEQKQYKWKRVTGLWENDKCILGFQMTDITAKNLAEVPPGTFLKIFPNENKNAEKQPDAYLCYDTTAKGAK